MKTHSFKNTIIFVSIVSLLTACSITSEDHVRAVVNVPISELSIPKTGQLNQDIEIYLTAIAPNGCYRNVKMSLNEIDNRHFLFEATSLFESYGVCAEVLIQKDTVIYFKPTSTGKYYFQTNASPFGVRSDTVVVN